MLVRLLFVSFLWQQLVAAVRADGFQSVKSPGAFHTGAMFYDSTSDRLYLTGMHYNMANSMQSLDSASNCFLASIDMNDQQGLGQLDMWQSYGQPDVLETCSTVTMLGGNTNLLVMVGSTEPGGFLPGVDSSIPLSGMAAAIDKSDLSFSAGVTLTARSSPQVRLLYPVSVVSDGNNGIYIAALTSIDATLNTGLGRDPDFPNWQVIQKYGKSLDMTVLKLTYGQEDDSQGDAVLQEIWKEEFPVQFDPNQVGVVPRVYIGGLVVKRDSNGKELVIVAGSTRGRGRAYGDVDENDDEDGFVTILDANSGFYTGSSTREGTDEDDVVGGICDDPSDPDAFYIVGATEGLMGSQQAAPSLIENGQMSSGSLQPFVRKASIGLGSSWTVQWAALPPRETSPPPPSFSYATSCSVSGDTIYVAGTVHGGASMVQGDTQLPSQGGNDVWIASLDKNSGQVHWLTQLGSAGDEQLASHGGIVVNKQGNPLILGDTTGNMFRSRIPGGSDTTTDMFAMSLDANTGNPLDNNFLGRSASGGDGRPILDNFGDEFVEPAEEQPDDNFGDEPSEQQPDDNLSDELVQQPDEQPDDNFGDELVEPPVAQSSGVDQVEPKHWAFSGAALALLLIATSLFCCMRHMKNQKAEIQKNSIFFYLQQFAVEDIDLRKSPPGGWHGTYLNELAHGVNKAESRDGIGDPGIGKNHEIAPLTHSSVVTDSLFMDTRSDPKLVDGDEVGFDDITRGDMHGDII